MLSLAYINFHGLLAEEIGNKAILASVEVEAEIGNSTINKLKINSYGPIWYQLVKFGPV